MISLHYKFALREKYGEAAAHPYHLALGYLLQRYCGYLNHLNRCGDVLAESRGAREDKLLEDSYARIFAHGVWSTRENYFQKSLTSKELKVKKKMPIFLDYSFPIYWRTLYGRLF